MKALKQVRLVYKQHLLPPLVLPLQRSNRFLKSIHYFGDKDQAKKEERLRLDQINANIVQQILKYKQQYIAPLHHCPFYYEMLDAQAKQKMLSSAYHTGSYAEIIAALTSAERLKFYRQFKKKYKEFAQQLQASTPNLLTTVKYLPLFVYESPQDLLSARKKSWSDLTEFQQINWRQRYQKQLRNHWKALTALSNETAVSVDELLSLQKQQLDPELPQGLKMLLFN